MRWISDRVIHGPDGRFRLGLFFAVVFVLLFVSQAVYDGRQLLARQSRSLDSRQELLESAPVPRNARLITSRRVGDTGWWCMASPGCDDPKVEVSWQVTPHESCDVPWDVARAWQMTDILRISDCDLAGDVKGRWVGLSIDTERNTLVATS